VEILRIPQGKTPYPYDLHSAQWEFYHVISGKGSVRHEGGTTPIEAGDAFIFGPDEPHQLSNAGPESTADLIIYVVADGPGRGIRLFPGQQEMASSFTGPTTDPL
jgi:mannose-6-phosphate isomerase-like protein (cupin superfamily)